jgi:hypothetical protein
MTPSSVVQAWIELKTDDPEAFSALSVAQRRLAAGRWLERLRRLRLVEITGSQASPDEIARRLHGSTQFYNPHKERCTLRASATDAFQAEPSARLLLVFEPGGERRPAAERWWRHETGEIVEVREGIVWVLGFAPGVDAPAASLELARVRDTRHGLFCNPWFQAMRVSPASPPLPWIVNEERAVETAGGRS